MSEIITMAHGSGGKFTNKLIKEIFMKHFNSDILQKAEDAAQFTSPGSKLAFTTDSFVISPIFFRGGNIGKLSVCGTVNDLAAAGAIPKYLSCGFIIEEGFRLDELDAVAESMGNTAKECAIQIVAGDTKVVQKGAADRLFINTSGIGFIPEGINISASNAKEGDKIIVTGGIAEHGCSIFLERNLTGIQSSIISDCAPLSGMIQEILYTGTDIHVMRDPTRGGLAAALNEIAIQSRTGIRLIETEIPVKDEVRGICELVGLDYLYMANEGKMIIIAPEKSIKTILDTLKRHNYGRDACVIGEVTNKYCGHVVLETIAGGGRIIDMPAGDQLPRIC